MEMAGHGPAMIRLCPLRSVLVPTHNWPAKGTISKAKKGKTGERGGGEQRQEGVLVQWMLASVRGSEGDLVVHFAGERRASVCPFAQPLKVGTDPPLRR